MKMIFAMLHSEDVDETVEELNKEKYWVTKLSAQVRVSPSNIRCPLCRPEVLALAQTR